MPGLYSSTRGKWYWKKPTVHTMCEEATVFIYCKMLSAHKTQAKEAICMLPAHSACHLHTACSTDSSGRKSDVCQRNVIFPGNSSWGSGWEWFVILWERIYRSFLSYYWKELEFKSIFFRRDLTSLKNQMKSISLAWEWSVMQGSKECSILAQHFPYKCTHEDSIHLWAHLWVCQCWLLTRMLLYRLCEQLLFLSYRSSYAQLKNNLIHLTSVTLQAIYKIHFIPNMIYPKFHWKRMTKQPRTLSCVRHTHHLVGAAEAFLRSLKTNSINY